MSKWRIHTSDQHNKRIETDEWTEKCNRNMLARARVSELLNNKLSEWEMNFCRSILSQTKFVSEKQAVIVTKIHMRYNK